jgi:4-carboxymuconolactone decarboxylase
MSGCPIEAARRGEMSSKKSERHSQGMETRRSVLGSAHVDRAEAAKTPFDAPFQDLITEAAWGHVWSRQTITKRERSMITLALLAGLGNFDEVAMHTRATVNTGASRDDIMEAMLHVAIYAGVPRANHAIKIIKQVFEEMDRSSVT